MKKGIQLLIFVIILFVENQVLFSQKANLNFYIDFSRFRYDSSKTYMELYYSFNQSQFHLKSTNEGFRGSAVLSFRVNSIDGELVYTKTWRSPFVVKDTSSTQQGKQLIGVRGLVLKHGIYKGTISGYDENNPILADSVSFDLKISPIIKDSVYLSDPEICNSINQIEKDENNIFYKNTLEVIPNPGLVFGIGLPIVFVYLEAYNLLNLKGETYRFITDVYDQTKKKIKSSLKIKKKKSESSVEVVTINCSDIPSGTYYLICSLIDEADTLKRSVSYKRFFVYNPHIVAEKRDENADDLFSNEYALMTDEEIKREAQIAKYLSTKYEVEEYDKIKTPEGRKKFMVNFWKKRNEDPNSTVNSAKDKFQKSVNYSNSHFRTGQREGWRTDRGRVHITYGQPDEIERHPNEIDSKPYEIWYYNNIEGGITFVFIDRSSMGDYILVHSTYRNELRDDNWQRLLK